MEIVVKQKGENLFSSAYAAANQHTDNNIKRVLSYFFKGQRGWYINNCLISIGKEDPVAQSNSYWWDAGYEDYAKQRRVKKRYYVNVLVIEDDEQPENKGKVMVAELPKQVFDVVENFVEAGGNPFDMWDPVFLQVSARIGANRQWSYGSSKFLQYAGNPLTDAKREEFYNNTHDIDAMFTFKSYDELLKDFLKVCPDEETNGYHAVDY